MHTTLTGVAVDAVCTRLIHILFPSEHLPTVKRLECIFIRGTIKSWYKKEKVTWLTKQIGKECSIKATFRFHLQQKKTPRDMTKERGTMYKPIQVQKPHSKFSSNMKTNHAISWRIGIRHEPRATRKEHTTCPNTHAHTYSHTHARVHPEPPNWREWKTAGCSNNAPGKRHHRREEDSRNEKPKKNRGLQCNINVIYPCLVFVVFWALLIICFLYSLYLSLFFDLSNSFMLFASSLSVCLNSFSALTRTFRLH